MEWIKFGGKKGRSYNYSEEMMSAARKALIEAGYSIYIDHSSDSGLSNVNNNRDEFEKACTVWMDVICRYQDAEFAETFEGQGLLKIGTLLRMKDKNGEYLYLYGGNISDDEVEESEDTRIRNEHTILEYKYLDLA